MDRSTAIDIATKRVLKHQLERVASGNVPGAATAFANDGAAGTADLAKQYLAREAKRNQAEIAHVADELMNGPAVVACCQCAKPSTATIAGAPYCNDHAATANRLPRPAKYDT